MGRSAASGNGTGVKRMPGQPDAPHDAGVDCLVGSIAVTYQEIESRIKKCVESTEFHESLYPESAPGTREQSMVDFARKHQKRTHPGKKRRKAKCDLPDLDKLWSAWSGMRESDPGIIPSDELVRRVRDSCGHRNSVAHAMRVCGDAAVRNSKWQATYNRADLECYLSEVQETLTYIRRLHLHLGIPPMG